MAAVITGAVAMALFLNAFVFQSYYVDGESMAPTLHTNDRLIISKVERSVAHLRGTAYVPKRGQIVVINGQASPDTAGRAPELIKRVIGVPGDKIEVHNGTVRVTTSSGAQFDSDEALGLDLARTFSENNAVVTVPEGHVFVLGDNRGRGGSLDSRSFGMVRSDYIDGRLWMRIMPFSSGRVF